MRFKATLVELAGRHGISLTADQLGAMEIHRELLLAWGARMNLTAIQEPDEIARRHFLEGILAGELLRRRMAGPPLLDLGSGNGFPAVPIAVMAVSLRDLILVESSTRRAAFLRALVRELGWNEARVITRRIQGGRDLLDLPCSTFTVRGVRPYPLLKEGLPFLKPGGSCLLFLRRSTLEAEEPAIQAHLQFEEEVVPEGRESGMVLLTKRR